MFFKPLRTWGDWMNQGLHILVGGGLSFLFSLNLHVAIACALSISIGVIREMLYQHPWECGPGCRTDLAFWSASSLGVLLWSLL